MCVSLLPSLAYAASLVAEFGTLVRLVAEEAT
jgi:hypothetical protein